MLTKVVVKFLFIKYNNDNLSSFIKRVMYCIQRSYL